MKKILFAAVAALLMVTAVPIDVFAATDSSENIIKDETQENLESENTVDVSEATENVSDDNSESTEEVAKVDASNIKQQIVDESGYGMNTEYKGYGEYGNQFVVNAYALRGDGNEFYTAPKMQFVSTDGTSIILANPTKASGKGIYSVTADKNLFVMNKTYYLEISGGGKTEYLWSYPGDYPNSTKKFSNGLNLSFKVVNERVQFTFTNDEGIATEFKTLGFEGKNAIFYANVGQVNHRPYVFSTVTAELVSKTDGSRIVATVTSSDGKYRKIVVPTSSMKQGMEYYIEVCSSNGLKENVWAWANTSAIIGNASEQNLSFRSENEKVLVKFVQANGMNTEYKGYGEYGNQFVVNAYALRGDGNEFYTAPKMQFVSTDGTSIIPAVATKASGKGMYTVAAEKSLFVMNKTYHLEISGGGKTEYLWSYPGNYPNSTKKFNNGLNLTFKVVNERVQFTFTNDEGMATEFKTLEFEGENAVFHANVSQTNHRPYIFSTVSAELVSKIDGSRIPATVTTSDDKYQKIVVPVSSMKSGMEYYIEVRSSNGAKENVWAWANTSKNIGDGENSVLSYRVENEKALVKFHKETGLMTEYRFIEGKNDQLVVGFWAGQANTAPRTNVQAELINKTTGSTIPLTVVNVNSANGYFEGRVDMSQISLGTIYDVRIFTNEKSELLWINSNVSSKTGDNKERDFWTTVTNQRVAVKVTQGGGLLTDYKSIFENNGTVKISFDAWRNDKSSLTGGVKMQLLGMNGVVYYEANAYKVSANNYEFWIPASKLNTGWEYKVRVISSGTGASELLWSGQQNSSKQLNSYDLSVSRDANQRLQFLVKAPTSSTFVWPTSSRTITTNYMPNGAQIIGGCGDPWCYPATVNGGKHYGIDIDGNTGDRITAAAGGTVIAIDTTASTAKGNYVKVKHNNDIYTGYYHLSQVNVYVGQYVSQEQLIGLMGNTGVSFGTHLHFQMGKWGHENEDSIDPANYLPGLTYTWLYRRTLQTPIIIKNS